MNYTEFFSATFLFKGVPLEELDVLLRDKVIEQSFLRGDMIYSPQKHNNMIGFVYDGECEVCSDVGVPLNKISVGDSFGILVALTDNKDFPTTVFAKKNTTVLFLENVAVVQMYKNDFSICRNIMDFLIDRIKFLNSKIGTFSADCVEKKLAKHLLFKSQGCDTLTLNLKHTAEALSIGRASLYRALSSLEEKQLIRREEKQIIIIDPKGLERI